MDDLLEYGELREENLWIISIDDPYDPIDETIE